MPGVNPKVTKLTRSFHNESRQGAGGGRSPGVLTKDYWEGEDRGYHQHTETHAAVHGARRGSLILPADNRPPLYEHALPITPRLWNRPRVNRHVCTRSRLFCLLARIHCHVLGELIAPYRYDACPPLDKSCCGRYFSYTTQVTVPRLVLVMQLRLVLGWEQKHSVDL